jgi:predicted dehydrogenase
MTPPHRFAIIGLGIMGRRMLANMRRHPAFAPVAMWDPSAASCDEARQDAPEVPIVGSADEAMAAADGVYLACPPAPRKAYALSAATAGKPLFLEKPLGIDVDESRDLAERLESIGLPCAVNFTQAASQALVEVRRATSAGEIGPIVGIDIIVTYSAWPRAWQTEADWLRFRAEGGFTREVISHFVFLSERLIGRTELIWARPHFPRDPALCESHILARLEASDGTPVTIMGSVGGAQPDRQEVTVKGVQRSYRFRDFYELRSSEGGDFVTAIEFPTDPRVDSLQRQLTELDKCVRGQPHILATVREALSVQETIEDMLVGKG